MATTTQTATGQDLGLESGTWVIDSAHSSLEAVARHLMVSKVRGRFEEFEGTIEVGDHLADARVEVTIDAASINTNTPDRDEHLRSPDFLDVENHPELTFVSTDVTREGDNELTVRGDLTIRGETNEVELDVTYLGIHEDPWGNEKAAFTARATLNREEWGMTWNQALETGGVLVGKKLDVQIDVQLQQQDA